jgi:hypothetical protein
LHLEAGDTYSDTTFIGGSPPVPNRECNLTKWVRTAQGLRFCPVVLSVNARVKPDWVLVNGKEERHPEGSYYIEWREGATRIRVSVGKNAADSNARRLRKEAELNAVNNGVTVSAEGSPATHRLIASAVQEYLEEIKISRSTATHSAYELALRNFAESCPKSYLEDARNSMSCRPPVQPLLRNLVHGSFQH